MTKDEAQKITDELQRNKDPEPDSDWKYGKNYGLMLAAQIVKKYTEGGGTP